MRRLLFSVVAVLAAALVITGCDSGVSSGGGASTLTITTSNTGTATTYTMGPINNYHYYDPSFSGACDTAAGMLITMCSGVTGNGPCNVLINIKTSGMTPGGYNMTGNITGGNMSSTYFLYMNQGVYYDSIVSQGTITLTSVGNVGQPIEGTFDAVLELRTDPTTTMGVSGTFSVIRDH